MSRRGFSLQLHRWVGLLAAVFLFLEGTTGGIIAWGPLLYRQLEGSAAAAPADYRLPARSVPDSLAALRTRLEQDHPRFRVTRLSLRAAPDLAWSAVLEARKQPAISVWFDPHTGQTLATRNVAARSGAWLLTVIDRARRLHGNVFAGVGLFLLAVSGLILWWPRRIFFPRRPASARQANFDLHAALGFYASAFLLIFAGTAMLMGFSRPAVALIRLVTPASAQAAPDSAAVQDRLRRLPRLPVPLDLDQAEAKLLQAHPGALLTSLRLFDDRNKTIEFSYRPGSGPVAVTLVNAATGGLQEFPTLAQIGRPERIVRYWAPRLHQGQLFGNVSLGISGLVGFALAALAVTGPLIWWLRRKSPTGQSRESTQ